MVHTVASMQLKGALILPTDDGAQLNWYSTQHTVQIKEISRVFYQSRALFPENGSAISC